MGGPRERQDDQRPRDADRTLGDHQSKPAEKQGGGHSAPPQLSRKARHGMSLASVAPGRHGLLGSIAAVTCTYRRPFAGDRHGHCDAGDMAGAAHDQSAPTSPACLVMWSTTQRDLETSKKEASHECPRDSCRRRFRGHNPARFSDSRVARVRTGRGDPSRPPHGREGPRDWSCSSWLLTSWSASTCAPSRSPSRPRTSSRETTCPRT
jgi:hypothetical protein